MSIPEGEAALTKLAAVKRKRPDAQKLASQAGRALEQVKAHKYFSYRVNEAEQRELGIPFPGSDFGGKIDGATIG